MGRKAYSVQRLVKEAFKTYGRCTQHLHLGKGGAFFYTSHFHTLLGFVT